MNLKSPNNIMQKYMKKRLFLQKLYYRKLPVEIGAFSYGRIQIPNYNGRSKCVIGKFCSIGKNVKVMLGGDHRTEWCSTYPFSGIMREFYGLAEHSISKGNVIIGNDVWICDDAKIMSGVTIGDGAVVAANALVCKNVDPYTVVGGVPAKVIRKRFSDELIEEMLRIKWWNWPLEKIYEAVPILESENIGELIDMYNKMEFGE